MKIMFYDETNGVAVIHPSPELSKHVGQIALKDVPPGRPFVIVEDDAIPDRGNRQNVDTVTAILEKLHGFGIGSEVWSVLGLSIGSESPKNAQLVKSAILIWSGIKAPPKPDGMNDEEDAERLAGFEANRVENLRQLRRAKEALATA